MRIIFFICLMSVFIFTACANKGDLESNHDVDPKPVRINKENNEQLVVEKNPNRKYIQSDEEGVGKYGTKREIFNSRESREISQQLARRDEIAESRVAVTPNRVVVFASLHEYPNDIEKQIEEDVKKFVDGKQITVFTDRTQWERMQHLDSSLKQREIGENVEQFLERYFNIDIKDD